MKPLQAARRARNRMGNALAPAVRAIEARSQRFQATRVGRAISFGLRSVTATGWAVLAAVMVAAVVARVAGWVEAGAVVGVGGFCFLVAIASVVGTSDYAVAIKVPQLRTRVGQTLVGELHVTNRRARRSRAGVLELTVGAADPQFLVPSLPANGEWSEVFGIPARRRGVVPLGPARSVRGDALGLLLTIKDWTRQDLVWVHPRTVRMEFDTAGFQSDVEGVTTARLSSSDVSFHALREYSPGDDRRHVHWPTTARTGKLTVRQFEETRRSHHTIFLDTSAAAWTSDEFELGVSVTASLALTGLNANRKVSVATSSEWISTASPLRVLDHLTELTTDPGSVDLDFRIRRVIAGRRATSVLTVVCGPATTDAELARWAVLVGMDISATAVRVGLDRPAARYWCGRMLVADCPSLDDLPRLMHRRGDAL